jgi:hypothetical protein
LDTMALKKQKERLIAGKHVAPRGEHVEQREITTHQMERPVKRSK